MGSRQRVDRFFFFLQLQDGSEFTARSWLSKDVLRFPSSAETIGGDVKGHPGTSILRVRDAAVESTLLKLGLTPTDLGGPHPSSVVCECFIKLAGVMLMSDPSRKETALRNPHGSGDACPF